ncbi:MAG TPA: hypothetical protein VNJ51_01430 [Candidatus Dormibacteraeota bacterium]|nr:hypothetical protein [Candidatus Dormibacteraeota bacterium]
MEHQEHAAHAAQQPETFANHTIKIYIGIICVMTALAVIIAWLPS